MSREERARQFLPFAALKGFEEMLKEVENAQNGEVRSFDFEENAEAPDEFFSYFYDEND